MGKIKTSEAVKDIKLLDKSSIVGQRMKDAFVRTKDTAQNLSGEGQGSSGDSCRERSYSQGYYEILGYGAPAY